MKYLVHEPRTRMFLAKKERPKNLRMGSGFGQDYRWVRSIDEATAFDGYSEAELPTLFLRLRHFEIRPLLSCGLAGDPVDREEALANGTFRSTRAA